MCIEKLLGNVRKSLELMIDGNGFADETIVLEACDLQWRRFPASVELHVTPSVEYRQVAGSADGQAVHVTHSADEAEARLQADLASLWECPTFHALSSKRFREKGRNGYGPDGREIRFDEYATSYGYTETCGYCRGHQIVRCGGCGGGGWVTCGRCGGGGRIRTQHAVGSAGVGSNAVGSAAVGSGYTYQEVWENCGCYGGQVACGGCGGQGTVQCGPCGATGVIATLLYVQIIGRTKLMLDPSQIPERTRKNLESIGLDRLAEGYADVELQDERHLGQGQFVFEYQVRLPELEIDAAVAGRKFRCTALGYCGQAFGVPTFLDEAFAPAVAQLENAAKASPKLAIQDLASVAKSRGVHGVLKGARLLEPRHVQTEFQRINPVGMSSEFASRLSEAVVKAIRRALLWTYIGSLGGGAAASALWMNLYFRIFVRDYLTGLWGGIAVVGTLLTFVSDILWLALGVLVLIGGYSAIWTLLSRRVHAAILGEVPKEAQAIERRFGVVPTLALMVAYLLTVASAMAWGVN